MMRSPWMIALLDPFNIALLSLSMAAGLCAAWWLLPIGLLIWLIAIIGIARDPALKTKQVMNSRAPLAWRLQPLFDRIEKVQVRALNSISDSSDDMKKILQPIQVEVDVLTQTSYQLCQRMTTLENYRVNIQSSSNTQADLAVIDEKIAAATDSIIKRELTETRKSIDDRGHKLNSISNQLYRVEAQLLSLANAMDDSLAEVIRIQAAGIDEAKQTIPEIVKTLKQEREQLNAFGKEISQSK